MLVMVFGLCLLLAQYPFVDRLERNVLVGSTYVVKAIYFPTERFANVVIGEIVCVIIWVAVMATLRDRQSPHAEDSTHRTY